MSRSVYKGSGGKLSETTRSPASDEPSGTRSTCTGSLQATHGRLWNEPSADSGDRDVASCAGGEEPVASRQRRRQASPSPSRLVSSPSCLKAAG